MRADIGYDSDAMLQSLASRDDAVAQLAPTAWRHGLHDDPGRAAASRERGGSASTTGRDSRTQHPADFRFKFQWNSFASNGLIEAIPIKFGVDRLGFAP